MRSAQKIDALFVGYEHQENLGLRYIMAYLEANGYRCMLVPYTPGSPDTVVRAATDRAPRLIGFSIIFQYYLREFGDLMQKLRRHGVAAHFTAGGHFPSLCPERTLAELPALDSVVRFEGELTTLELVRHVHDSKEWQSIAGIAFRNGDQVVVNPVRPLVTDLDNFPWPRRGEVRNLCRGLGTATMLASRGCLYDCSFCSIRQFYAGAPGPLRRVRSPEDVAAEMKDLYQGRDVRLFLFQDDDFAAKSGEQRRWIERFLRAIDRNGLRGSIGWKISCRVDDVEPELMSRCHDHGLMAVYLGVESGNDIGLQALNKRVTVGENLAALLTLKDVGVEFDLGFMLFDPDSTFQTVRDNLAFLTEIAGLGGPPLAFVKMLPLAGTAIQHRLTVEGRLTGDDVRPDYDLLDPRLNYYSLFVILKFSFRNSDPQGLVERLRLAHFDGVVARSLEKVPWADDYLRSLHDLIDTANEGALDLLKKALLLVEGCSDAESVALSWPSLNILAARERRSEVGILSELNKVVERYSPRLHQAFREEDARREAIAG